VTESDASTTSPGGGNLYDDATAGWDHATGLGTPRGTTLARAIDAVKGVG